MDGPGSAGLGTNSDGSPVEKRLVGSSYGGYLVGLVQLLCFQRFE